MCGIMAQRLAANQREHFYKGSKSMAMPKIDPEHLKKPLCYDPSREKYIFFDEIVSRFFSPINPPDDILFNELKYTSNLIKPEEELPEQHHIYSSTYNKIHQRVNSCLDISRKLLINW